MNSLYRSQFIAKIEHALNAARGVGAVEHQGLKGTMREILVKALFSPLLPADIQLATGVIVSAF